MQFLYAIQCLISDILVPGLIFILVPALVVFIGYTDTFVFARVSKNTHFD